MAGWWCLWEACLRRGAQRTDQLACVATRSFQSEVPGIRRIVHCNDERSSCLMGSRCTCRMSVAWRKDSIHVLSENQCRLGSLNSANHSDTTRPSQTLPSRQYRQHQPSSPCPGMYHQQPCQNQRRPAGVTASWCVYTAPNTQYSLSLTTGIHSCRHPASLAERARFDVTTK